MASRSVTPFAPDHELYRRIRAADVVEGRVQGEAIRLDPSPDPAEQATSVQRQPFCAGPDQARRVGEYNGIAVIVAGAADFTVDSGTALFRWYPKDEQFEHDPSHAHIRLQRLSPPAPTEGRLRLRVHQTVVKEALAARLTVAIPAQLSAGPDDVPR